MCDKISLKMTKEEFIEKFKAFHSKPEYFADNIDESWYETFLELGDTIKPIFEELGRLRRVNPSIPHYPSDTNIFRCFKDCKLTDLKVVVLGQDPYHDGSATGLAFDNLITNKMSPSLKNIFKEMEEDLGKTDPRLMNSNLGHFQALPLQGVLLLNTALTVEQGKPESHLKIWEPFTKKLLGILGKQDSLVWVIWGAKALAQCEHIDSEPTKHKFVTSSHPSPLGAKKPMKGYPAFVGSKPFSKVNSFLKEMGKTEIQW